MNRNILISLIIPVYNTEKFLNRCLDSVVNQTYKNLEIILINDGSTDGSLKIIEDYAKKDRRIKFINQENKGGGEARNAGLDMASGDYIGFVDSDDYVALDMFEILAEQIDRNKADLAICDFISDVDENGNAIKPYKEVIFNNKELMKELFLDYTITSHLWRKLYPSRVFDNIRFSNKKVVHDMSIDHLLLKSIEKAVYINKPLYIYCESNENNLSNTNAKKLSSSLNRANVMMERMDFAEKYYPDLTYILLPQVTMFLLSSFAKSKFIGKNNTENNNYLIRCIKDRYTKLMSCKEIPLSHKIVLWSIKNDVKLISYLASKYYITTML